MSILITGSSGFIGSNLIEFFKSKKVKFFCLDKRNNKYLNCKDFYKINLKNRSDLEKILKKKKPKYIIHLAALPGFVNCHNSPDKAFNDNILATFNLIYLSKKYNVKKILIASSMGVDNFKISPSIYALTKYFCEQLSYTYIKTKNVNITICKISNVYGPYSLHKSSVVHSFIKKILNNKPVEIHKNGLQERDFIYSKDVCKILYKNLFSLNKKKEVQVNTKKFLRIMDIKKLLDDISKNKNELDFVPTPNGYDDKIYHKPIMKADKNFIKNLKTTFNWYKDTLKK